MKLVSVGILGGKTLMAVRLMMGLEIGLLFFLIPKNKLSFIMHRRRLLQGDGFVSFAMVQRLELFIRNPYFTTHDSSIHVAVRRGNTLKVGKQQGSRHDLRRKVIGFLE